MPSLPHPHRHRNLHSLAISISFSFICMCLSSLSIQTLCTLQTAGWMTKKGGHLPWAVVKAGYPVHSGDKMLGVFRFAYETGACKIGLWSLSFPQEFRIIMNRKWAWVSTLRISGWHSTLKLSPSWVILSRPPSTPILCCSFPVSTHCLRALPRQDRNYLGLHRTLEFMGYLTHGWRWSELTGATSWGEKEVFMSIENLRCPGWMTLLKFLPFFGPQFPPSVMQENCIW